MALFKHNKVDKHGRQWGWEPASTNLSNDQAWALLTNAIYFKAVAPRLDTLGGGLDGLDWQQGLATWWGVTSEADFDELVDWMQTEGYRAKWSTDGVDDGDEKFAWDYCRLITVAGGAAIAQVIASDKAWDLVLRAGDKLADRFQSWEAVGDNYLAGRILWLQDKDQWDPPDPSQAHFEGVANALVADPTSPWNRVSWDRSQGLLVDGEPRAD